MSSLDPPAPSASGPAARSAASASSGTPVPAVLDHLDDLEDLVLALADAIRDARQVLGVAIDLLEESSSALSAFREGHS